MKKEKIIFIISLVMMLLATSISVYATSCLYNSSDVSYTAPTGSGLSANVQDSLTEVYGHCTDYTSMDNRVSSLEGHFLNNATSYFDGNLNDSNQEWLSITNNNATNRGIRILDNNNVERSLLYHSPSDGGTYLVSKDSSGAWAQGTLQLRGDPVMINGTDISTTTKSGNLTIDTTYTKTANSSSINYVKIGKLVIVNIYDICPKQNSQASYSIATGLPEADGTFINLISNNSNSGASSSYRLAISNNNTKLVWWWVDGSSDCKPSSGQLIYISKN